MIIELRGANVPISEALRTHVLRKVGSGLARVTGRVASVIVRIVDLNGPKGGSDKRCRMVAQLSTGESVIVESIDHDPYAAASSAAARLRERIVRATRQHRAHPPTYFARRWASSPNDP